LRIAHELRHIPELRGVRFVACGKKFDESTSAVLEECGLGDSLIQVESAADDVVLALYSMASGLVFPSLVEGFGLPVLEAMACGCPVFTSNRLPMTEVGGNAARYFDPTSPRAAACTIADYWDERDLMTQQGYAQAQRFSAAVSSAAYAEWYRMILRG
jgi:glycosyltransferase involved in cell wall biosynthesis